MRGCHVRCNKVFDVAGPRTTAPAAAGLAGLLHAMEDGSMRARIGLGAQSRVLGIVTEGLVEEDIDD